MKISKVFTVLAIMMCMVFVLPSANAQKRKKTKKEKIKKENNSDYFEDDLAFKDKLWYGGGLGLGFSGSTFNFSLSPMVGYKIFDRWSAGPRIPFNYLYIKGDVVDNKTGQNLGRKGFSVTSIGIGAFTRYKVIEQFFLHAEYGVQANKQLFQDGAGRIIWDNKKDKVYTESITTQNASVGVGYSSGEIIGYEVSVLYDFLLPDDAQGLPFDIRIGFNYKF